MPRESPDRDPAILLDIFVAATRVRQFVAGVDALAFQDDLKTQSAVLHQLLVIGEATKRLSHEFRALHPSIPWTQMSGMRDHLIHGYDDVDLSEVWSTATVDIPKLLAAIEPLVPRPPA
ncbi:MAG: DUF86 domain-containing protein [Planctomycetota bacterium]